jgi:hypothetical protein
MEAAAAVADEEGIDWGRRELGTAARTFGEAVGWRPDR